MNHNLMLKEPELSFDTLHRELNDLLKDTFENAFLSPSYQKISAWRPAVEIKQSDKDYKVKVQLPGVNKEDIHVDLNNDYMTVSAEMKQEKESKTGEEKGGEKIHTSEFRYGKFVRTISFDHPIKTADSNAEYVNGVLTITMPKQKIEKTHAKRLTIK